MLFYFNFLIIILGLSLGSYIYTTIYRITHKQRLSHRSQCDSCKRKIKWYYLIPVLGYLIQKGRCHFCKKKIAINSTWFELLNCAFLYIILNHSQSLKEFIFMAIIWELLLFIAFLDFKTKYIYTTPVIIIFLFQLAYIFTFQRDDFLDFFIGLFVATGLLHFFGFLYEAIRNRKAFGEGDSILFGILGFLLGWQSIFPVILIASIIGVIFGLFYLKFNKKKINDSIPFAPALCLGAFIFWRFPSIFYYFFPQFQFLTQQ